MQKLIGLAEDESNEHEARTAAVKAIQLMRENDLHVVSGEALKTLEKAVADAQAIAAVAKDEKRKSMLIGAGLGYLLGGGKLP